MATPSARRAGREWLTVGSVVHGLRWSVDRMLSVGYGVVYDYIFDHFEPYRQLQQQVVARIEAGVGDAPRLDVHVLEVGCGPGNFALALAEAGFSVVGLDPYEPLLDLAREKRHASRAPRLAFRSGDLARGDTFPAATFDWVVSIHALYSHPQPARLLREAARVLKPGGHGIFVNHTRQLGRWATFRDIQHRDGPRNALRSLVWLVPNSVFEAARRRIGPHYWGEVEFASNLRSAGFTVLESCRTFLEDGSILMWVRKDA